MNTSMSTLWDRAQEKQPVVTVQSREKCRWGAGGRRNATTVIATSQTTLLFSFILNWFSFAMSTALSTSAWKLKDNLGWNTAALVHTGKILNKDPLVKMMVNSVPSAMQLQTLQFDLKLHQKLSMPKTHSSIASLVRFVQHKHQLLCEIAMQFSTAPSCYLFNWVYYTLCLKNIHMYLNVPPFCSCACRLWCLQQSMLMAMCWQCRTICLCTTILNTGGELEDSIPRKVRLLIWNMVGISFSLVGIAILNVDLFGFCLWLLVSSCCITIIPFGTGLQVEFFH